MQKRLVFVHNALLAGPPGAGKTLIAKSLPGILPRMSIEEALEVTKIYSVADLLPADTPLIRHRPSNRVTLTPQVFNSARKILFLVAGEGKAEAVKAVINGPNAPRKWPAQHIRPEDGLVYWLLDEGAASQIA